MKNILLICFACFVFVSCRKETTTLSNAAAANVSEDASETSISQAIPATYWNDVFTRYNKGQWTGGDVAYSHLLPDGRSFWLFGDSFVDSVYPDRHRKAGPFIHNSIVLTDAAGGFNTLYGGTVNNPKAFFDTTDPIEVWPNSAFINADQTKIYVMMVTIKATGDGGLFGFETVGNTVAEMSLPDLTVLRRFSFGNSEGRYDWSSATLEDGDYVYIYGAETTQSNKLMHVCRTLRSNPFATVEFYDGSGWTTDESKSAKMLQGISEQYS
ncbi:MAG TPA: hypothetical protein PL045_13040, partial [Chitinophagaceae bacterium]|nr:hypothetical protein [Chitinophagaceae bacterium]